MPGLSADRHLPSAQLLRRSTASLAVLATGTTFCAASINETSSSAARRQQERISAPVQSVSFGRSWLSPNANLEMYIFQIDSRSAGPGRSKKKIPSNRSARENSGGILLTSLAVQITNESLAELLSRSLSQDNSVPNIRAETPESVWPLAETPAE